MEKTHIYHLGLILGLRQSKLKTMMESATFLDDVIAAWLRKEDQVTEKGEPNWKVLINALRHRRVGQTGIASKIATEQKLLDEFIEHSQGMQIFAEIERVFLVQIRVIVVVHYCQLQNIYENTHSLPDETSTLCQNLAQSML